MSVDLTAEIKAEMDKLGLGEKKEVEVTEKDVVDQNVDTDSSEVTLEPDPFLEEALKSGYDPNHKGPNKKTPEQFVKDGSFFKKIDAQNKKIDELINFNKQQMELNKKIEKASYEKALKDIEAQKLQAVADGDMMAYQTANQKEGFVKEQYKTADQYSNAPPEITQELRDFQERNKDWFNNQSDENIEMAQAADAIDRFVGAQAARRGQSLSQDEHLKLVEDRIKALYPHRFKNANQDKPQMVTRSTVSTTSTKSPAENLSQRQKDFIRQAKLIDKTFKTEDYIKQLRLTGELRDE